MKRIPRGKFALLTAVGAPVLGAVVLGGIAGCASTTSESSSSGSSSTSSSGSTTTATGTSDTTTSYKDGTYTADGSYSSPDGQEEIAVTVTLKNNLITAVTVKTVEANGEGQRYQQLFASSIGSVAVGKSLASLNVAAVAGASLTSQGFNTALDSIRSEAA